MSRTRVAGWALLVLLPVLVVSCGTDKAEENKEIAVNLRPLDAEPYRAEIQALEAILFRKEALEAGEAEVIATALKDLADKLDDRATGFLYTILITEIRSLSREALWRGEKGDRGSLRADWSRIRGSLFDDAPWFCWKAGKPRPVVAKKPVTASERELAEYTRVLDRLEALVARGRRDVRSMGELPQQAAADPGLYATQIGIWEDTGSEWNDELVVIEGELPEEPAREENTPLYLAHMNLTRAIRELRSVPFSVSGGRVPTIREREKRIDAAEDHLRRVRQTLERIPG